MPLEGKVTDFGDLLHVERWVVKGRRLHFFIKIGPVSRRIIPPDAAPVPNTYLDPTTIGRTNPSMDLKADQRVELTIAWEDEMGNPTSAPDGVTIEYTVDDAAIIALTDNEDGTAVAASTGTLGTANVHAVISAPGFPTTTGDLQIVVVAGDAHRATIVAGEPTEVTPDEPTPTPA